MRFSRSTIVLLLSGAAMAALAAYWFDTMPVGRSAGRQFDRFMHLLIAIWLLGSLATGIAGTPPRWLKGTIGAIVLAAFGAAVALLLALAKAGPAG